LHHFRQDFSRKKSIALSAMAMSALGRIFEIRYAYGSKYLKRLSPFPTEISAHGKIPIFGRHELLPYTVTLYVERARLAYQRAAKLTLR
jgi:hypothetical protein